MNKNLLIGVGALAVVGVGAFLFLRKRKSDSEGEGSLDLRSETLGGGASAQSPSAETFEADPTVPLDEILAAPKTPLTPKEARQVRRGNRRDCSAEAKSNGLKRASKKRREFMRECKAAGGINADFAGEEADFAFNGFTCFN